MTPVRCNLIALLALFCVGCISSYEGPTEGVPTALISFEFVEGELNYLVRFEIFEEVSETNCWTKGEIVAIAERGYPFWETTELSNIRIPADRDIEIRSDITAHSFMWDHYETIDAAFRPLRDHSYLLRVEWSPKYLDVRLLDVTSGQRTQEVPVVLAKCGGFTSRSEPL